MNPTPAPTASTPSRSPLSPPRCEATLRGRPFRWAARSYSLWMLRRTLDAWRILEPPERQRVRDALAGTGWEPLLD